MSNEHKPKWNTEVTHRTLIIRLDPTEWLQAMSILPERKWEERLTPDIDDVLDAECRNGWRLAATCFIPRIGVLVTLKLEHGDRSSVMQTKEEQS